MSSEVIPQGPTILFKKKKILSTYHVLSKTRNYLRGRSHTRIQPIITKTQQEEQHCLHWVVESKGPERSPKVKQTGSNRSWVHPSSSEPGLFNTRLHCLLGKKDRTVNLSKASGLAHGYPLTELNFRFPLCRACAHKLALWS